MNSPPSFSAPVRTGGSSHRFLASSAKSYTTVRRFALAALEMWPCMRAAQPSSWIDQKRAARRAEAGSSFDAEEGGGGGAPDRGLRPGGVRLRHRAGGLVPESSIDSMLCIPHGGRRSSRSAAARTRTLTTSSLSRG